MNVRAKFKVASKTIYSPESGGSVVLQPVVSGSEENKTFWEATPSGKIEMFIQKPNAFAYFVPGAEYYIDFSEVVEVEK